MISLFKRFLGIESPFKEGDLVRFDGPNPSYDGEIGIVAGEAFKITAGINSHSIVPVLYENKIIDVNPCFLKRV